MQHMHLTAVTAQQLANASACGARCPASAAPPHSRLLVSQSLPWCLCSVCSAFEPDATRYLLMLALVPSTLGLLLSLGLNYVPFVESSEVVHPNSRWSARRRWVGAVHGHAWRCECTSTAVIAVALAAAGRNCTHSLEVTLGGLGPCFVCCAVWLHDPHQPGFPHVCPGLAGSRQPS